MPAEQSAHGPNNLSGYLAVIRRRKFLGIGVVLVVTLLAVLFTLRQPPTYRSSVTLAIQTPLDASISAADRSIDPNRALRNEIEFITSDVMDKEVAKKLDPRASIEVSASEDSDVINIVATGQDPELVATTANRYAESYKHLRITQVLDANAKSATELQDLLADVTDQINALNEPIAVLDFQIAGTPTGPDLDALQNQRTSLLARNQRTLESLISQQSSYRTQLTSLGMRAESIRSDGIRTLQEAGVPDEPVGPNLLTNIVVAVIAGAVIALGVVLMAEYLDDSIKTREALERIVSPVIGVIPGVVGWKAKDETVVVTLTQPSSPESEAYRTLRTSVKFLGMQQSTQILQVTSPNAGEGKSSTVANLAVTLAKAGDRVLVVSGDLRRPRLESFFGLDHKVGLTTVLLGDINADDAVIAVEGVAGLFVLPTGELPPNPSELLAWQRTEELIRRLSNRYSIVIIDSPPVLPVTDALVTARFCDATIVVARAGHTSRRRLHQCVDQLLLVEANLLGGVLNDVKARDDYHGGAGYGYGYGYYPRRDAVSPSSRQRDRADSTGDPTVAQRA